MLKYNYQFDISSTYFTLSPPVILIQVDYMYKHLLSDLTPFVGLLTHIHDLKVHRLMSSLNKCFIYYICTHTYVAEVEIK
jgi:hypothetical protein